MDDREFFDTMYQGWSKTTGAEDMYWMPEEKVAGNWAIKAVAQDETTTFIAAGLTEADAAFITAIHGCYADLTRRLHSALDEADRLDRERDEQEAKYAEACLRIMEMDQDRC